MINDFRDLIVWQKSRELVKHIYLITKTFPESERYGLVSQMRKAAVSIPSNIAEGNGRGTKNEYVHFLNISSGSKCELLTQIILCIDLGYINENEIGHTLNLLDEIGKMLNSMIQKLKSQTTTD